MNLTINDITALAPIPEELHGGFLRVANGLMERANYPKEKVMEMLAKMLNNPKKYAFSKNKLTNLAQKVYDLQKQGTKIVLTEAGRAWRPVEPSYELDAKPKSRAVPSLWS